MKQLLTSLALFVTLIITGFTGPAKAQTSACTTDSSCTALCGYAGAGKCVSGTHCMCATCPQRSTAELSLAYAATVCTPDPICQQTCPASSYSVTSGQLYSGHTCVAGDGSLVCICFCMPTTAASLGTVIQCPVVPASTGTVG